MDKFSRPGRLRPLVSDSYIFLFIFLRNVGKKGIDKRRWRSHTAELLEDNGYLYLGIVIPSKQWEHYAQARPLRRRLRYPYTL